MSATAQIMEIARGIIRRENEMQQAEESGDIKIMDKVFGRVAVDAGNLEGVALRRVEEVAR